MKNSPLIIANWKMYPKTLKEAKNAFNNLLAKNRTFSRVEAVIAPPFPYIGLLPRTKHLPIGAQDIFWEKEGSFTGEVSGNMLKQFGVKYVIVGHSERRQHLGETDDMVNKKVRCALKLGLHPVLCIGERKRDSDGEFFSFIRDQIIEALKKVSKKDIGRLVIAYEPLWSISPGKPAKPRDANEAALFIKRVIAQNYGTRLAKNFRVLYGGSADAKNAESFLREREISGLLVGKESRNTQAFITMLQCAHSIQ